MYAYPEKKKYKLNNRGQVHAAIAHFSVNRGLYSQRAQREIARNIKAKARNLGIHVRAF